MSHQNQNQDSNVQAQSSSPAPAVAGPGFFQRHENVTATVIAAGGTLAGIGAAAGIKKVASMFTKGASEEVSSSTAKAFGGALRLFK
jgi:hypothetical protein